MCNTFPSRSARPASGRRMVCLSDLYAMVDAVVCEFTQGRCEFTAYGVTLCLRQRFPHHEIIHGEVRQRVHQMMQAQQHPPYSHEMRCYGSEWALTYVPARKRKKNKTQVPRIQWDV